MVQRRSENYTSPHEPSASQDSETGHVQGGTFFLGLHQQEQPTGWKLRRSELRAKLKDLNGSEAQSRGRP